MPYVYSERRALSSVVNNYETEIHTLKVSKVIRPCNANRNERARGRKTNVRVCKSQDTRGIDGRLFALKKEEKK